MKETHTVDLVILGGGPAGMTAAIYAAHANLKTVLLDESVTGGLVNSTHTVQNYPSYPSIHGMELMEKMREHVDQLEVAVEEVCEIESIDIQNDIKSIETDEAVYNSHAVILATGRKPKAVTLPTECEQIHYCAICDGGPYKNKRVLVVGGGNSGFDEGLYLMQLGVSQLTIIEAEDRFFAAEATQQQLLGEANVEGRLSTRIIDVQLENGQLAGAVVENRETGEQETIPVDGIFVFLGQTPNNEAFKDTLELSDAGYIKAGDDMSTSVPGVYGAGDINDKAFRQITTAMSDATIAALSAERYIRLQKRSTS